MSAVHLPLSGNVPINQAFSPFMPYFPMFGSQVGSYTVNVGDSTDPATEKAVLDVASYGKQLGRIEDVLLVLLRHVDLTKVDPESDDGQAISDLRCMLNEIAKRKQRHRVQKETAS